MERNEGEDNVSRRNVLRVGIAVVVASAASSFFLTRRRNSTPETPPEDFEPIVLIDDGFMVERVGVGKFVVTDTRFGAELPDDRMPYLKIDVLGTIQNDYGCDILDVAERPNEHDLVIQVANPQCFFEVRDNIQQDSTPKQPDNISP